MGTPTHKPDGEHRSGDQQKENEADHARRAVPTSRGISGLFRGDNGIGSRGGRGGRRYNGHLGDEPIPALRQRLNEPRVLRRVAQSNSQFPHRDVERLIEVAEPLVGPNAASQLVARSRGGGFIG